jgi:hypothetical protein
LAYLHDPNNRSKNYFEVLQEKETSVQPLTQSVICTPVPASRLPFQRIAVRVCSYPVTRIYRNPVILTPILRQQWRPLIIYLAPCLQRQYDTSAP